LPVAEGEVGVFAITIIAANYVHFARVLAQSFSRHNPDSRFYALLIDRDDVAESSDDAEPFTILTPKDLRLDPDEFHRMALMYEVTELATALKPWALEALLDRGADVAVYLDPDIRVYAPLDNVEDAARQHGIALTPHGLSPMERDGKEPSEAVIMQSGIYNLGFIALNQERRDFLDWWKVRLLRDSISAPEQMLFTDQRWIDLIPGYWDVAILRDPGLNVAYWNLDQRNLTEEAGRYFVAGQPLQFYHFSGFDPTKPWQLSKDTVRAPRVLLSENRALANLCAGYSHELIHAGLPDSAAGYAFGHLSTGVRITKSLRRHYRQRILQEDASGSRILPPPFSGADQQLLGELTEPFAHQPLVNSFMMAAWEARPDLHSAFPDPLGRDAEALHNWCRTSGVVEESIEEWQLGATSVASGSEPPTHVITRGVNVHGYLTAELGMGELGRRVLLACEEAGIPVTAMVNHRHVSRNGEEISLPEQTVVYPIDIAVINADQIENWATDPFVITGAAHARVGVWAWEVEEFPAEFDRAFDYVDEVWAISDFCRDAIAKRTHKPVYTIPLPQRVNDGDHAPSHIRESLGLPVKPYFLVSFDYLSVMERKNPMAAITAFRRAFGDSDEVPLIIKTINGDKCIIDREKLRLAIRDAPNIHVIEDYLRSSEVSDLVRGALAYVSLHRSEGYGLTCADAMGLRVPVIATEYSGNLDFMTPENSLLVPFDLVPVDASVGVYPSTTVWADPDTDVAANFMRLVVENPSEAERIAENGFRSIRDANTTRQAADFVSSRIDAIMSTVTSRHRERVSRTKKSARNGTYPIPSWRRLTRPGD